jgi:hypothetical protein
MSHSILLKPLIHIFSMPYTNSLCHFIHNTITTNANTIGNGFSFRALIDARIFLSAFAGNRHGK